jgi:hypothetical protein
MEINETTSQSLHKKLPIDADEKILAIYKHHWFAYVSSWFISVILVISIIGLATLLTSDSSSPSYAYRGVILAGAGFFCLLILLGGLLPAYLRSQEQLVLTEEALLQILQDFFGTMFGFGKITIETPGEQNNYHFFAIPSPHEAARAISAAHENFDAALQGGRLHSNLTNQMPQTPQIDPQQYAEFLKFQQMQNMQQGGSPQSSSSQSDKNDQSGPGQ